MQKIYYVFWKSFFALAVTISLNYLQNWFGICKYQIPLKICYVVWYVQWTNIITNTFKIIIPNNRKLYRFKKNFHLIHSLPILSMINVYQCDINVSPFRNSNKWKLNKQCIHYNFSHLVVLFRDIYTHIYHFGYGSLLFIIFLANAAIFISCNMHFYFLLQKFFILPSCHNCVPFRVRLLLL